MLSQIKPLTQEQRQNAQDAAQQAKWDKWRAENGGFFIPLTSIYHYSSETNSI